MATAASSATWQTSPFVWLGNFLRKELEPYPGRGALVARMVVTASIVMLVDMTFKIPFGAYATIYALTTSRDNPDATLRDVKTTVIGFVLAAAHVLIGAVIFTSEPVLRLVWVLASLFLMFFALSAVASRTASARFGYLVAVTLTLWDSHIRAEQKVVNTLWAIFSLSLANIIIAVVELVYVRLHPVDQITGALLERLHCVASLLRSLAAGVNDKAGERRITTLAALGTSRIRRDLLRADYSSETNQQESAIIAMVGRLVDLGANLTYFTAQESDEDRRGFEQLAARIEVLSDSISGKQPLHEQELPLESPFTGTLPLLREMERTVTVMGEVLSGAEHQGGYHPPPLKPEPARRVFVADAFSNPDHVRFGIRGGLAASICYLTYNLVAWPGISTAVTTCILTALTTVGASRQKQILRFAGAIVGGVILGFGAQMFILPAIDSIAGFLLLFLAVTTLSAWISASGPRLSYFGVQVALAFYLINLQEFRFQTSLAVARDRIAGILLGLLAMWLVFDQLWGASAAVEMERTFVSTLRLLARMMRAPVSPNPGVAIEETYSIRETINTNFDRLRQQADGVMLEFGPTRVHNIAMRSQLLNWQIQLRVMFVVRITLLKYRLRLPGFEVPEAILKAQKAFDGRLAERLEGMADRLSGKDSPHQLSLEPPMLPLEKSVEEHCPSEVSDCLPTLRTLLPLCREIESILSSLEREVASA